MFGFLNRFCVAVILVFGVVLTFAKANEPVVLELENGVTAVLLPMPTDKVVVLTRFNVGNLDESIAKGEVGLAHFLEHLLAIRGTESLPSREHIVKKLKSLLADYNASTTFYGTNYFLIGPSENVLGLIEMQGDQVTNPVFLSKDPKVREAAAKAMKKEMEAVVEEAKRGLVNPHMSLFEHSIMVHAENERLKHLMTGTAEQIRAYTPEMVEAFYKTYYTGPNALVFVAGGIEDFDAVAQAIDKAFGKLSKRAAPAPAQAKEELRPSKQNKVELVKVRAPGFNTRLLNINYPLRRTNELEAAAELISKYLNRRGAGSMLEPLVELGYISPLPGASGLGVFSVRDLMFFRAVFDITPAGEQKIAHVTEYVHRVLGEIAKNGLPDGILEQMKQAYAIELNGSGMLDSVTELSESAATNGVEKMMTKFEAIGQVTQDQVKEVAAKLLEPRAELTVYSSNLKGAENEIVGRVNFTPELLKARAEYAPIDLKLDARPNPFFAPDQAYMTGDVGKGDTTKIIVVPETQNLQSKALIEFNFIENMRSTERLALDLAMLEFRLRPEHAAMFSFMNEAGIEFGYSFDVSDMKMSLSVEGNSKHVTMAAHAFLEAFRSFEPSPKGFTQAKRVMIESLRDAPVAEVSGQAVNLGVKVILGGRSRQLESQIHEVAKLEFAEATKAMLVVQSRWGVKATLGGNWDQAALNALGELIEAPKKEKLRVEEFKADLPVLESPAPEIVVQKAEVERHGVARLYPMAVQPFTKEYWAMTVFAEMFSDRLANTVRGEHELAYAVQAGFAPLPKGGTVFYMFGDTSKAPGKMALAYTVSLFDSLMNAPDKIDFEKAKYDILQMIGRNGSGLEGLHSREMEGINWSEAAKIVKALTPEEILEIARNLFDGSKKLDTVATHETGAFCSALLKDANAIDPTVQSFFKNVLPRFKSAKLSAHKRKNARR